MQSEIGHRYIGRTAIKIAALGLMLTGVFVPLSSIAQWSVSPALGIGLEYDDNPILLTDSALNQSAKGYQIEVAADLAFESPTSQFVATPLVLLKRYNDFTDLNSDEYFFDSEYTYTGQRSGFQVRASYGDESTRTAERSDVNLDVNDPDQIPIDNSGRVIGLDKRQRFTISPQWTYRTGQRSLIRLGADYIDVRYDKNAITTLTDYSELTGSAAIELNWSERSAFVIQSYVRKNQFDTQMENLSGYGATLGINHSITENLRLIVDAGIDSSEDENGDNQQNSIGEVSLVHTSQRSRLLLSYRSAITGSGAGVLFVRNSLNFNFTHNINQKITLGLGMRAYRNNGLDNQAATTNTHEYLETRGLLSWHLTRKFTVDFDYRYTYIDRNDVFADGNSNRVNVWFRYATLN